MSDHVSIPTLGKEGAITDSVNALNYVMMCFFFSKYSQSAICRGSVISLTKVIQSSGHDANAFMVEVEVKLEELLTRHFHSADVTCSDETPEDESDMRIALDVTVTTGVEGNFKKINLGYALTIGEGQFKRIIDTLNGEALYG